MEAGLSPIKAEARRGKKRCGAALAMHGLEAVCWQAEPRNHLPNQRSRNPPAGLRPVDRITSGPQAALPHKKIIAG